MKYDKQHFHLLFHLLFDCFNTKETAAVAHWLISETY